VTPFLASPPSPDPSPITGGLNSIGKVYANDWQRGYDLVLVARDQARLELLAVELRKDGATSEVLVADLTKSDDVARVEAKLEGDPAISSSSQCGHRHDGASTQDAVAVIERSSTSMDRRARLALAAAGFYCQKSGTLVNMASAVAINPERFNAVYSASRPFVLPYRKR